MKARDFRKFAREMMQRHTAYVMVAFVIYGVIMSALSGTLAGVILLGGPLTLGLVIFIKTLFREDKAEFETLFKGLDHFMPSMITYIIEKLFILLWSLLFIIPGVIKMYAYSMSMYLLEEDPTLEPTDVLKKSQAMMRGHKWRLFCLDFSYIGWLLLSPFTFGILLLWIIPWMQLARYKFYLDLKEHAVVDVVDIRQIR